MKEHNKKQRLKTMAWAFRIAWNIDHWTMLLWFLVCGALAILPAVALQFNRDTLSVISGFLSGAPYTYADVVKPIVKLGLLMIAIGLSARVNSQFVRMMTYDSYFGGMYAYIMEHVQDIDMKDLLRKEVNDMWMSAILEGNSLWAFVEGICFIFSKLVGITALLITARSMSRPVFLASAFYVAVIFIISLAFSRETRRNQTEDFNDERQIEYYERMSENRGMAKETRIFENTDQVIQQWKQPYLRIQKRNLRRSRAAELRDFITGAGFYAFLIIAVGVSIAAVARGSMRPDALLVIFTLCLNLLNTISDKVSKGGALDLSNVVFYAIYNSYRYSYDMSHVLKKHAAASDYESWLSAYKQAVPYHRHSVKWMSNSSQLINYMNHFSDEGDGCGDVSMFFPGSYYDTTSPNWNKAIQQFQWNDVIHWEQYGW